MSIEDTIGCQNEGETCAVCGKAIRPGEDHIKVFHSGVNPLLCCASCAAKFEAKVDSCW